ncbi:transcriptional regulator, AraC family [Reichenbachiella faecimaris]|uniref:Transcriptional regulator, AraC family n=2 Tax=Reichenbachiella faecimaris TaxID=692418 RepID=A0A1W2GNU9_REIFA|nr:transcriptional regulator, AraC family [Reichenbachiella faecimaris]
MISSQKPEVNMQLSNGFYETRRLEHLVENRTTYTLENAEMNVYETHHYAEEVVLQFHQPVFASMIEGKKIMHLREQKPFDFLPGESIIMPANEIMKIDFPEAATNNPTKCLAMTISPEKINRVVENINEQSHLLDDREWQMSADNFAFTNDPAVSQIIQRLIFLFAENHTSKDYFVDMMIRELIIRVLQKENRRVLADNSRQFSSNHRLAATIDYIKKNLHLPLAVSDLCQVACMSESSFHRVFRSELGVSPIQFINEERIKKATRLLKQPKIQIKEVYLSCGFNNLSYFIRTFKKTLNQTPKEYQTSFTRMIRFQ